MSLINIIVNRFRVRKQNHKSFLQNHNMMKRFKIEYSVWLWVAGVFYVAAVLCRWGTCFISLRYFKCKLLFDCTISRRLLHNRFVFWWHFPYQRIKKIWEVVCYCLPQNEHTSPYAWFLGDNKSWVWKYLISKAISSHVLTHPAFFVYACGTIIMAFYWRRSDKSECCCAGIWDAASCLKKEARLIW